MRKFLSSVFCLALLIFGTIYCSSDSGLNGSSSLRVKNNDSKNGMMGDSVGSTLESFKFGPDSTPTDLLVVFDNSVSMNPYIDKVRNGFTGLVESDWKGDVKIGVMNTLPGNPSDLNKLHDIIALNPSYSYPGIAFEPGFLSLVSAEGLKKFLTQARSPQRDAYKEPLCDSEWFSPSDKNRNNQSCLRVALQSPFHGVGCEPGMTALGQILDKKPGLFRTGSFVQILFVSDAQDPGCPDSKSLIDIRPSGDKLQEKIKSNSRSLGVRFHGIVPIEGTITKETEREGYYGFPYNQAIKSTNGILLDITAAADYSGVAKQVASSRINKPQFILANKVAKVLSIKVDGTTLTAEKFHLGSDEKTITIHALDEKKNSSIVVNYVKK